MDTNMKILVVDDFPTMRRIIRNLLNELGFHKIMEAEDGRAALTVLKANPIDYLITDWNMPIMAGIDLLIAVRADPALAKLPVLLVTAEAKREQIVQAAEAGVNGYIIKPFTAQTLKEKLEKTLERLNAA